MAEYIDRNLIEWYGCNFENASCQNRECAGCSHAEVSHAQVMQIPIANVIEIPDGATNGDMFMLTYPTSIVTPNKERGLDVTVFLNEAVIFETWFPITWWNAPYESKVSK